MRDITLLIAHPDDEALFAWPVLDRVKKIVCVSNDKTNASRHWCRDRGLCLNSVGELLGAEVVQYDLDSEFYRLPTRGGELKAIATNVMDDLRGSDIIYTHNGWGEYGNIDHILCHHIARTLQAQTGCQLLISDIAQEINWLPVRPWALESYDDSGADNRVAAHGQHTIFDIDRPLFGRIKAIYDARGCWTWAWEPQGSCQVFSI